MRRIGYRLAGVALTAAALGPAVVLGQQDPVVIPDPVRIDQYLTEAISRLGSVVAVAVGGYFGFLLVRMGLRWARRAT